MLLTRTEQIVLMIASTVADVLAVVGFLNVPSGAPLAQRMDGVMLPLAIFGCLTGVLIGSHMMQWGVEMLRRSLTRPGRDRA